MENSNEVLANRIAALEKDAERNSNQHREFFEKFNGITVKQGILDNTLSQLVTSVNELRNDVKSLTDEPRQNYNAIKMCVVTAIISGVVGFALSFVFK